MRIDIPDQSEIIKHFGEDAQGLQACEELGELIQAVSKIRRAIHSGEPLDAAYYNLVEEMADVLLLMDQLKTMYGITDRELQAVADRKVKRIRKIVEGERK